MDDIYYRVDQSGKVKEELASLRERAISAGHGREVLEALRVIDAWLRADRRVSESQRVITRLSVD